MAKKKIIEGEILRPVVDPRKFSKALQKREANLAEVPRLPEVNDNRTLKISPEGGRATAVLKPKLKSRSRANSSSYLYADLNAAASSGSHSEAEGGDAVAYGEGGRGGHGGQGGSSNVTNDIKIVNIPTDLAPIAEAIQNIVLQQGVSFERALGFVASESEKNRQLVNKVLEWQEGQFQEEMRRNDEYVRTVRANAQAQIEEIKQDRSAWTKVYIVLGLFAIISCSLLSYATFANANETVRDYVHVSATRQKDADSLVGVGPSNTPVGGKSNLSGNAGRTSPNEIWVDPAEKQFGDRIVVTKCEGATLGLIYFWDNGETRVIINIVDLSLAGIENEDEAVSGVSAIKRGKMITPDGKTHDGAINALCYLKKN